MKISNKRIQIFTAFILGLGLLSLDVSAQNAADLKGHDTKQVIDISADRGEARPKEGRAIFSGSVQVTQGKLTMASDKMTVFYDTVKGSADPSISRLDAVGHFKLVSASETINSQWAIYDVERKLVTIGGKVTLVRGDTVLSGERLELDLVSGLTKLDGDPNTDGRVKGRFSIPKNQ